MHVVQRGHVQFTRGRGDYGGHGDGGHGNNNHDGRPSLGPFLAGFGGDHGNRNGHGNGHIGHDPLPAPAALAPPPPPPPPPAPAPAPAPDPGPPSPKAPEPAPQPPTNGGGNTGGNSGGGGGGNSGGNSGGGGGGVGNPSPQSDNTNSGDAGNPSSLPTTATGSSDLTSTGPIVSPGSDSSNGTSTAHALAASTVSGDGSSGSSATLSSTPGSQPTPPINGSGSDPSTTGVNGDGSSASPSNLANGAASQSQHHISKGAVAAIVLVVLAVVAVVIFILLRRRNRSRRSAQTEEKRQWWFNNGEKTSSQFDTASMSSHGTNSVGSRGAGRISPEERQNIQSMRSSFGTSIDRGLALSAESYGFTDEITPSITQTMEAERQTIATVPSVGHGSSDHHNTGQTLLTIPSPSKRDSDQSSLNGPMSVRPFSPSESFKFPKPPIENGTDSPGNLTPTTPGAGFWKMGPARVPAVTTASSPPTPMTPVFTNPFSDPAVAESQVSDNLNTGVETFVRRPFIPTRDDELSVVPTNAVRVLKMFDDGWCFCEVVSGQGQGQTGLIPMECLRDAGQEFPSVLATKRSSSNPDQNTTKIA